MKTNAKNEATLIRREPGLYESRNTRFIARQSFGSWEVRWVKSGGDVGSRLCANLNEARTFVRHANQHFIHFYRNFTHLYQK